MKNFESFHYDIGCSNLENKINLLYNGNIDCLLVGKFIGCYNVDEKEDVYKYLNIINPNRLYNTYTFNTQSHLYNEYTIQQDNSSKYLFIDIIIPAIELSHLEIKPFDNFKNIILSKYALYHQSLYKYILNSDRIKNIDFELATNIDVCYLLNITNLTNLEIFPAYIVVNNKHYLCLLPKPVFFNIHKTVYSTNTGDKYFTEMYSLEELNSCLENYTKHTTDKYISDNVVLL